mmetsp:Transcript_6809/g.12252  ORF Transcript_6809/g.12252 Transcript_6809/m.12252 type:complete len:85 (-) Transcript_6809:1443-1697(-)
MINSAAGDDDVDTAAAVGAVAAASAGNEMQPQTSVDTKIRAAFRITTISWLTASPPVIFSRLVSGRLDLATTQPDRINDLGRGG